MSKMRLYFPNILLLILSLLIRFLPFLVISQSPSSELEILLKIKEQWGSPPILRSWHATTSHCQWLGIKCTSDGTVSGISLGNQNITGEFPPAICDLNNLTTLDLGYNNLGGPFPTTLYRCTNLHNLNLTQNLFGGQLPHDINNLSPNLQQLDLSYNNFIGDIPSSIGQLKGLITLHLRWNLFNGTFPSELGNLENLEVLVLAYNTFSPMELPTEFGSLKSIKFLWMTNCNLIGEIPGSFANLHSLEQLDLAYNQLRGVIPSGLLLLKNLKFLYLYRNNLSGEIPTSIETLNLVKIDLSDNKLTGSVPEGIASLPKLELLSLFNNRFNGILPANIGLIPTLKRLKLWNNTFSGLLPPELGRHSHLETLEVSDNKFTGQLPDNLCLGGAFLGVAAQNNLLNGSIPKSLGQCHSLEGIELYSNSFSGEIPEGLWTLKNLSFLLVSNNRISGQLPHGIAGNIARVEIKNNRLSGEIPSSMRYWHQLQVFEASNNLISGTIPLELTTLSSLRSLSLDGNNLSGELPSKIISWSNLSSLNLSRNELSGSIPPALASLTVLKYLDLSNNKFSGQIPPELGHLKLSSLNLSSNKLTGRIPYGYDNAAYQTSFLDTNLCSVSRVSDLSRCKVPRESAPNVPSKFLVLITVLSLLAFVAIPCFIWYIISELRTKRKRIQEMSWKLTSFQRLDFTEENILANLTTANLIGSGGSGIIYRIRLNVSGNVVAAKMIQNKKLRNEKEFLAEVQILGTIGHVNIVKLLCCMSSENSKILVYEYMENQSLDKWIHKWKQRPVSSTGGSEYRKVLDWPTRLRVAVGAARGLSYMHRDCNPPIIHRDVKSSNILLDSGFNAKIADFGLARVLSKQGKEHYTISAVAGSFGYMAPEYCSSTKVNEKIDVYSFGVVLLELVTGKEAHYGDEYSNLADWALRHYRQEQPLVDIFDEEVRKDCYLEEMTHVFMLGLMCTAKLPASRPPMKVVLQVLQRCNRLEGPGGANDVNNSDPDVPLLGNGSHICSCSNTRREINEDNHVTVSVL